MLTLLWLALHAARAADGSDTTAASATADASEHAEYVRLEQELEKLSTRNAWSGVERTYESLVATGIAPTFKDYIMGAHAARSLGDVTSARQRLLAANAITEDKEVLDWLWDIDSNYGVVYLACDADGQTALTADQVPFDPDQAHAVEFAAAQIAATGVFEGYLPQGVYHFGKTEVKVQPRVQAVRIDLRTEDPKKVKPPKKKKEG